MLHSFQTFMVRHAKTPQNGGNAVSGCSPVFSVRSFGGGMSTIAFISPIVRNIMKPFHIARTRANYIAGFASGISWMVPHGVNTLTALAVAVEPVLWAMTLPC